MLFTAPFLMRMYYLLEWTVFAAKYTGEFKIQFRLDISEQSWSTMQEIVPRNKIARTRRPPRRATPRLLPGPHRRLKIFIACKLKLHGAEACVSGAVGSCRSSRGR
ncbi:hypothetical protein EVAR_89514_1 [Eumeta japonica]|uniref:Uncharacterized protein n=1 Tax=Eumeta variegata TaxID=151549 RepID=A0A4C1Y9F6_EUMVA|nr:hypothetical protein EVAR_89514_1 [Eumeta japonica]